MLTYIIIVHNINIFEILKVCIIIGIENFIIFIINMDIILSSKQNQFDTRLFLYVFPRTSFNYSTNDRLNQLKPLLQTWKTLETRLDQLQGDLRGDDKTLHFLDSVLEGGGEFTDQAAVCVRDIAKLLSETTMIEVCFI